MNELDIVSKKLPLYEEREGQRRMFADCQAAYKENAIYLIEAGTGIGKSIAYLLAALSWEGEPTIIATHTIALQEQILKKDLPFLLEALGFKVDVVLFLGMQNYLCLRKLYDEEAPSDLMNWARKTQEGTKSEYLFSEEYAAERESCSHVKCPYYEECFYFKAKKRAQDAKLVIINHHLLFADLAIRKATDNYDQPCILPSFNRLIIDEAHHIEDVATEYFAERVSQAGLMRLLNRIVHKLNQLSKKVQIPIEKRDEQFNRFLEKIELSLMVEKREVERLVEETFGNLSQFVGAQDKLRLCPNSVKELIEKGKSWLYSLIAIDSPKAEGICADLKGLARMLDRQLDFLNHFMCEAIDPSEVRWVEKTACNLSLIEAKLDIAPLLKEVLFDKVSTAILCSATLDFKFVRNRLGIDSAEERIYTSPFDYRNQALLTTFLDLPDPNTSAFIQQATEIIHEVIKRSCGNAFVLFTSYQMLQQCKAAWNLSYPLLVQGEEERVELLAKFRKMEGAVLYGTDSFWEGVDVAGEALRCVILVRLPFKVPSDPLFQARSEKLAKEGGSPFFALALPQAALKFKQGFGRLIRHKRDRGCVVCLDSRLVRKGYGKIFLKSLPDVETFFGKKEEVLRKIKEFYTAGSTS